MSRKQAFVAAIVAGGLAALAGSAMAQGAPAAIDVRSIAPSPTSTSEVAASGSGLTRDERKQQTIKARQTGTLKPAGEAGELRDDAASRSVQRASVPAPPVAAAAAPMPDPRPQAAATYGTKARGQPAHRVTKKSTAKAPGPARHSTNPVG